VAFRSASDAVRAARDAQLALAAEQWPNGVRVAVRMGLHTGEPAVRPSRYVGLGVHRAARICSAGHGGQVLVSKVTHDLVEDEAPPGLSFKDLGEQWLKDLDRPEHLYQLLASGLASEFPALRTVEPLPFAGREGELARAAQVAVERPSRRRRKELLAAGIVGVLAAGIAIPVFALGGGGSTGAPGTHPVAIVANSLLVLDAATGERLADLPLGSAPGPVTFGEGAAWVGTPGEHTISTVDPKTLKVTTFGVGIEPSGLAVGEGAAWAGGFAGEKSGVSRPEVLARVQPGSHNVTDTLTIARRSDEFPVAVAAGLGSVWVGHRAQQSLAQVDPNSVRVSANEPDIDPAAIALYDESVWVADYGGAAVDRIDPDTLSVTKIPTNVAAASIAAGEGAVWVGAGQTSHWDQVWKILPNTNSVSRSITVGSGVKSMAAGEGSVWVASVGQGHSPTISRIDPQSLQVTKTTLPRPPAAIAVGAGRVWVTLG
jgi:streptogramin lyase